MTAHNSKRLGGNDRTAAAGGLCAVACLVVAGFFLDRYLLSLLTLILFLATIGQAWNVMMGYAGQLSLGHALYLGLAAYVSAAMFQFFGASPWLGLPIAIVVCVLAASVIGWLAFRFGIGGTYFALLTIAFAEFARIGFDHLSVMGASGGFFLTVSASPSNDWLNWRGSPRMFYWLAIGMCAVVFAASYWILRSRLGYYFRAIRENEEAASASGIDVFKYKLLAVQISASLSAIAGVFYAFYYNNLFPAQLFGMERSIEIILAPVVGGLGTLLGPLLGAVLLTFLSEGLVHLLNALGLDLPGVKQILYAVLLGLVVLFMPGGVWPLLARKLGPKESER